MYTVPDVSHKLLNDHQKLLKCELYSGAETERLKFSH